MTYEGTERDLSDDPGDLCTQDSLERIAPIAFSDPWPADDGPVAEAEILDGDCWGALELDAELDENAALNGWELWELEAASLEDAADEVEVEEEGEDLADDGWFGCPHCGSWERRDGWGGCSRCGSWERAAVTEAEPVKRGQVLELAEQWHGCARCGSWERSDGWGGCSRCGSWESEETGALGELIELETKRDCRCGGSCHEVQGEVEGNERTDLSRSDEERHQPCEGGKSQAEDTSSVSVTVGFAEERVAELVAVLCDTESHGIRGFLETEPADRRSDGTSDHDFGQQEEGTCTPSSLRSCA